METQKTKNGLVRLAEMNAEANRSEDRLIIIAGPNRCGIANDHVQVCSPTAMCLSHQRTNPDYKVFYRRDFGNPPVKYDAVWGLAKRLAQGLYRNQAINLAMKFAIEKNIFAFLSEKPSESSEVIYRPEGQRMIYLSPGDRIAEYNLNCDY